MLPHRANVDAVNVYASKQPVPLLYSQASPPGACCLSILFAPCLALLEECIDGGARDSPPGEWPRIGKHAERARIVERQARRPCHRDGALSDLRCDPQFRGDKHAQKAAPADAIAVQATARAVDRRLERVRH